MSKSREIEDYLNYFLHTKVLNLDIRIATNKA